MVTKKVIPIKPLTSWSFSRYNLHQQCPAKFMYKNLMKLPEPANDAMLRGRTIHKLAEDYTKGLITKLPAELKLFKEEFAALKKQKVKHVEEKWTFRDDWSQTMWNDWNGAWLRIALDVGYVNVQHNAFVPIDHKTGKFSEYKLPEYLEQLELQALASFKQLPTIEVVSPRLWFLDQGIIYPNPEEEEIEYFRKDEAYLDKLWRGKIKPMMTDKTFKPQPGNACTFCNYKKNNGGPCKY